MSGHSRDFFGPRRDTYSRATHRPLNCLVFLLPLIVLAQVGAMTADRPDSPPERVAAFFWLMRFVGLWLTVPAYVPGLALVAVFLTWHVSSGARWRFRWSTIGGMFVESALLTLPLLVFNGALSVSLQAAVAHDQVSHWETLSVALTAGIYEELIFRLLLFWLLRMLLIDLLKLNAAVSLAAIIVATALLFSAYHYTVQPFDWPSFLFRSAAGAYLGWLYVIRGFGVTVGVHALYDVAVTMF